MIMKILIFLILSYGITNIIVFGSIFEFLRKYLNVTSPLFLGKLILCPLCLSMWVGMFLSVVFNIMSCETPMVIFGVKNIPIIIFFDGCFVSGGVWLIHTIQEYFEKK